MSSSAVPAPVPDPNSTPAPGLLASMLAPVDPARTAFSLTPQTATNHADGTPAEGAANDVSSDAFHGDDSTQQGGDTASGKEAGKAPQGVVRAWLLAGAERWRKGAGVNVKRLEVKAAQARAHQVKETRQVTTSPSPGINRPTNSPAKGPKGSGSGGAGGGSGKSLSSKSGPAGGGAGKSPTNSSSNGTAGAGRTPSPSGAGGRTPSNKTSDRRLPKQRESKTNGPAGPGGGMKNTTQGGGTGSSGTGDRKGPSKGGLSPGATGTGTKGAAGGTGGKGAAGKDGASTAPGDKPSKPNLTKDNVGKADSSSSKTPATPDPTPKKRQAPGATPNAGKDTKGNKPTTAEKATTGEKDTTGKPTSTGKTTAPTTPSPSSTAPKTVPTPGTKIDTRKSRETGYRDGTRGALATAHVKAYTHGVKDGWTDTTEAAAREKARLDKAHTDRLTARQETPVPLATSTDHHQTNDATPIPVDNVTSTHVILGEGAHRTSMTRGEVRSVKDHERRLEEQATRLTSRAEQTRGLKAHADQQAQQATRLLEAARSAKGGDKYIGALTKLEEAAKVQAGKAEEIYTRAIRGAEQCRTALSNVQARYSGIYQAVVDSPETQPAELAFYQG